MDLLRLHGRKNCDRVRTKGSLWKGKHLFVRWMPGAPVNAKITSAASGLYVGILASTKLDKSAVTRNRMRRRCREALRMVLGELKKSHSVNKKAREGAGLAGPAPGALLEGKDGSWKETDKVSFHVLQLLIFPRSSSLQCAFDELIQDVTRFLSSLRL